jgi:hypothetical protein
MSRDDWQDAPEIQAAALEGFLSNPVAVAYAKARSAEASQDPDLWSLLGGPKPDFCCQDAYASGSRGKPPLHTSGCPNRCGLMVPVPQALRHRHLPQAYPCALTRAHAGDHWLHPDYREDGPGRG